MANQGIKQYGTYYNASISNGTNAYVNLSKSFDNLHFAIPLYKSKYKSSPIDLSIIYTSSNSAVDYNFKTGFKLSILKELSYVSSSKYRITNADLSTEDYDYSSSHSRYENTELVSYMIIDNNNYKVVYKDSIFTFNTSYKLILIEDRHNSLNKINIGYTQGNVSSIYNNYGESLSFNKNTTYLEISISKSGSSIYKLILNYDDNYISSINYYVYKNNTDNLYKQLQLEFLNYKEVYDVYTKERIRIKHTSSSIYKVLEGNNDDEDLLKETIITYLDDYHTTVNYNNMYTHYYFDDRHLINHCVDFTKSIMGYTFDTNKNLTFKSNLFKNNYQHQEEINNLIEDGFCQQGISWSTDNATLSRGTNSTTHISVTSPLCLYISNANVSESNTYQIINVKGTPRDSFTFRCLSEIYSTSGGGYIRIYLLKGSVVKQTIPAFTLRNYRSCAFFNVVSIEPKVSFDKIKVTFYVYGTGTNYGFESMCLTKQKAGTSYTYNLSNEITKKVDGKNKVSIARNDNHKVASVSRKYSVMCNDYNNISSRDNDLINDDLVEETKGLFGSYTKYSYSIRNHLTKKHIITHEYDASISRDRELFLKKEYTYQTNHEFISRERTEDKEIQYTNDGTKHFLLKRKKLPNGTRYHYQYNGICDLTGVAINTSDTAPSVNDNNIDYNSANLEVDNYLDKRSNKTKFVYNNDNKLSSVRIMDENNNYKSLVNIKYVNDDSYVDPHLDLIESKEYGDGGDKYSFEYDNKENLSLIKFKAHGTSLIDTKYLFEYDSYNRLNKITDYDASSNVSISYDGEDRVNKLQSSSYTYKAKYDDSNNIESIHNKETWLSVCESFNGAHKLNERSPEKFYEYVKIQNQLSNANCYSCFFNEWIEESQGITRLNDLTSKGVNGEKVVGASDSSGNNIARMIKLIPELNLTLNDTNRLSYQLTSLNTKSIITFFNGSASGTLLSLKTNNNDVIELYKSSSSLTIYKNGQIALGGTITISFDYTRGYALSIVLEDNNLIVSINDLDRSIYLSATSFKSLTYGKTYLSSNGNIKLNGIIVTSDNDSNNIKFLREEGYNSLFESVYDKNLQCASGVEETLLVDPELAWNFEVFPLNNSFESINGNQYELVEYTKRMDTLDYDDFIFNHKNDKYSLYLGKNKVVYQTDLRRGGTILLSFTISEYSLYTDEKVLFRLYNDNSEIILSISQSKELLLKLDSSTVNLGIYINEYSLNKLGISYHYQNGDFDYCIKLNGSTRAGTVSSLSLSLNSDLKLQLGNNEGLLKPLNGFIEMLCISDIDYDISDISDYLKLINNSNYISIYDEVDRIKGRRIRVDDGIDNRYISNSKYEYEFDEDDDTNQTTRISKETFCINNESPFDHNYSYDDNGKITDIIQSSSQLKKYEYDLYGRVTKDKNYLNSSDYIQNDYLYDNSGNINKRTKSGTNINTEEFNYEYGYEYNNHIINKNALVRVKDINNNVIESIDYDSYMHSLPVSITKNNITTYLSWSGMRLKSYGNINYSYDYLGRRIKKEISNDKRYEYNYDIRGNLVYEKVTNLANNTNYIVRYLYDVNNDVYGFIYDDKTYYYVKNILGEILYIIDGEGYTKVTYKYDGYGNVLSIGGNMYNTLGNINHIIYKSYYMDFENNLYYLKTRYYNPSWGRFISSDKIEYLDPSVAGGLNLYAYCLNDPINNSDPEGTIDWGRIWSIVMYVGALLADPIVTMVGAVASTTSDIIAIGNIDEEGDIKVEGGNVTLKDSSKIHTPWMKYGYSIYLNYFNEKTKDIINGSSIGVEFEWFCHNVAYALTKKTRFNDLDVGHTIYDDITGRKEIVEIGCSVGMQLFYWFFHPFAAAHDFSKFIGVNPWQIRKRFTL